LVLHRKTKVPYSNRLNPDETPSNSASHPYPRCLTLRQKYQPILRYIEVLKKLKQTRNLTNDNLFCSLRVIQILLTQHIIGYCSFHISLSNAFWRSNFIFFAISSWNFYNMRQCFLCTCTWKQNFSLIRQQLKTFPIDRHDVAKESDFKMGINGEFLCLFPDQTENSGLST